MRAHVVDRPELNEIHIYCSFEAGGQRMCLEPSGVWSPYPFGSEAPPSVRLPREVRGALAEAFHPFAGGDREIGRLEEALETERRRVDLFLDNLADSLTRDSS